MNKEIEQIWSVKMQKTTKNWIVQMAQEREIPNGRVMDDLYEAVQQGIIKYDGRIFHGEDSVEYERQISEMQTTINLLNAKIRGLEAEIEERNANREDEITKREPENISEEQKEVTKRELDVNLNELTRLAAKHRVTEQSLLDMALRPYR